jgi:hypothetical protein
MVWFSDQCYDFFWPFGICELTLLLYWHQIVGTACCALTSIMQVEPLFSLSIFLLLLEYEVFGQCSCKSMHKHLLMHFEFTCKLTNQTPKKRLHPVL